jgi:hypothetical protein
MAARARLQRRVDRPNAGARACASVGVRGHRQMLPPHGFQSGCVDLYLVSAREGHITVALTGRGRGQLFRLRGIRTGIRAPVPQQVDDSTVAPFG